MTAPAGSRSFWRESFALEGAVTPRVLPQVIAFGALAALVTLAAPFAEERLGVSLGIAVAPYEVAGAVLGLLLVLRTNAGYDRWWEARKLWGGITNQCRNLSAVVLGCGPGDPAWRARVVRWTAAFPHVARRSLRGERDLPEVAALVGDREAAAVAAARHMPSYVARVLAELLREGCDRLGMSDFVFLGADRERALLLDHVGGCERIQGTPLPRVYAIQIRRFLVLFLATLPFALLHKLGSSWLDPAVTVGTAYALTGLDQIGWELQAPFTPGRLSALPLDDLCRNIENNLLAALAEAEGKPS
jgi:putative membrane protein